MNIEPNKRVLLCYKDFASCQLSHAGMGITAAYTAKSLVQAGYMAEALPIAGADQLMQILRNIGGPPVTHVILMAQFTPAVWLQKLSRAFPFIKFAQNCHSNVGFLQAEPQAIDLLRAAIDIETGSVNFFAAGNNQRFCNIISDMYGKQIQFLPNLYYLDGTEPINRPIWQGGTLKIGCFGSQRVYKNFSTAITAAIEVGFQLRAPVEIWVNSGRNDGDKNPVYLTALAWVRNLPNVWLRELQWTSWPEFRRAVGTMNLLLQPSYTESFNNVTADGVVEGVASVVSDAIDWVPNSWIASNDDPKDVARTARQLLYDIHAVRDGYAALKAYRDAGLIVWQNFLNRP
jgi:hypothetical protein